MNISELIHAVKGAQDEKDLSTLLQQANSSGTDMNAADKDGNTLLHHAMTNSWPSWKIQLLLNKGANPNLVNAEGYSALDISRVLGLREMVGLLLKSQNAEMTNDEHHQYRQQANLVRELGHVYGISNSKTNPILLIHPETKQPTPIAFELEHSLFSNALLLQFVKAYQQSENCINPNFLKTIMSALETSDQYLACSPAVTEETLAKIINDGQLMLTHLTSRTWAGAHNTVLAFYKNGFVYCNRGLSTKDPKTGTTVYLNPYLNAQERKTTADENTIYALKMCCYGQMHYGPGLYVMQADINEWLTELTKGTTAISLPSKTQRHSTCSFVNIKSSIQGILYLLEHERLRNSGVTDPARLHRESASYAQSEYKHFTTFMRDEDIKKLINGLKTELEKTSQQSALKVTFYTQLLIHAITAHHGNKKESSPEKKAQELARVHMIFKSLDQYPEIIKEMMSTLGESYRTLFQPGETPLEMNVTPIVLSQPPAEATPARGTSPSVAKNK